MKCEVVQVFKPSDEKIPLLCFLLSDQQNCYVVFRGTMLSTVDVWSDELSKKEEETLSQSMIELLYNILPIGKGFYYSPADRMYAGNVHPGFAQLLDEVWDDLYEAVRSLDKHRPVWLTGHSRGGALAVLTANRMRQSGLNPSAVYTFGCPRVGDIRFAESVKTPHFRFANVGDLIPKLPPRRKYRPVVSPLLKSILGKDFQISSIEFAHSGQSFISTRVGVFHPMELLTMQRNMTILFQLGNIVKNHSIALYKKNIAQTLNYLTPESWKTFNAAVVNHRLSFALREYESHEELQRALMALKKMTKVAPSVLSKLVEILEESRIEFEMQNEATQESCLAIYEGALNALYTVYMKQFNTLSFDKLPYLSNVFDHIVESEDTTIRSSALLLVTSLGRNDNPIIREMLELLVDDFDSEIAELAQDILVEDVL